MRIIQETAILFGNNTIVFAKKNVILQFEMQ